MTPETHIYILKDQQTRIDACENNCDLTAAEVLCEWNMSQEQTS